MHKHQRQGKRLNFLCLQRSHRSTPEGRGRPPILKKGQAEMSACIYSDKYVQFWLLHSTYIIDGQRCITSNFFSKVQLVLFLRMTSRRVTLNWYLTVFCVMHHWPSTFCNTQRRNFCVFYKLLREFFMWRRHSGFNSFEFPAKIQHQKLSITLKLIGTKNIFDVIFGVKIHMR